jgi:hypothetical protein
MKTKISTILTINSNEIQDYDNSSYDIFFMDREMGDEQ